MWFRFLGDKHNLECNHNCSDDGDTESVFDSVYEHATCRRDDGCCQDTAKVAWMLVLAMGPRRKCGDCGEEEECL